MVNLTVTVKKVFGKFKLKGLSFPEKFGTKKKFNVCETVSEDGTFVVLSSSEDVVEANHYLMKALDNTVEITDALHFKRDEACYYGDIESGDFFIYDDEIFVKIKTGSYSLSSGLSFSQTVKAKYEGETLSTGEISRMEVIKLNVIK